MAADSPQRREHALSRRAIGVAVFVAIVPTTVATSDLPFWQALILTTIVATIAILIAMALLGWHERRTAS